MINPTENDEREYLAAIREKLVLTIRRVDERVRQFSEELRQSKQYIHEHQSGMDEADMVAAGQSINRMAFTGESAVSRKKKLIKLLDSPYFARIDFVPEGGERLPVYIGIYTFSDGQANLIYDWRAPISSMFYDFEPGRAWYETPSGRVEGEIVLKRQFRIRDGKMEFMIENAVSIQDEVLQRELSRTADERMKNIVATIQRDQNVVIRNESSNVMIIQGVAGSGKTSIALHRIAFLLYRFRDTIASKDILIISPNKVFADYISNVLPELGEEQIPEMGMEELADALLENKYRFQTFFQQVSTLLSRHDQAFVERIRFKSSFEFLGMLNRYLIHIENNFFQPVELRVGKTVVPSPFIHEKFRAYHRIPLLKRIPQVVKDIQHYIRMETGRKISGQEKSQIWQSVPQMIRLNNILELYRNFYTWIGRKDMFVHFSNEGLEYSDVFPLIYCKIRLEGVPTYDHVRHLLVDEMQDYTPVQYAVLSKVFSCRKTILGDISQTVNPYSASSADDIHRVFPNADTVRLVRSYRSTIEIVNFALSLFPNPDLVPMERHGPPPRLVRFDSPAAELAGIDELIEMFRKSGQQSLGVICRTIAQVQHLKKHLRASGLHLITEESTAFRAGVIITTAHLSKGLEFDEVIVPFVTPENYHSDIDKRMLYIACTRAMHLLTLTHQGSPSAFVSVRLPGQLTEAGAG